jgi:hypothetical protein
LHTYDLPTVRPVTLIGLAAAVAVRLVPPSDEVQVAEYFGVDRGLPFACAAPRGVNDTRSLPAATRAVVGFAGRAGLPTTTAADAADARLDPTPFVALTVQVYDFPSDALPTVIGPAVAPVWTPVLVTPPLLEVHVAVNRAIGDPLLAPAA